MRTRLAWVFPLVLASSSIACKKDRATDDPDGHDGARVATGDEAWTGAKAVDPREVCEHLAQMVAREAGLEQAPIDDAMMSECQTELGIEAGIRGTDNWNGIAHCVLGARTEADIDACDRKHPMPDEIGAGPAGSGGQAPERELGVCHHMIEILLRESAEQLGAPPELTQQDLDDILGECLESLLAGERPNLSPDNYERLLQCIETSDNSESLTQCESS